MNAAGAFASVTIDPLAERYRELRAGRTGEHWPDLLLTVGRELTLATAGGIVGGNPPVLITGASSEPVCPQDWAFAAERARSARGVWAGPAGPHWLFAVPVGHVGPLEKAPILAVMVLEIATRMKMDLALTRERLAALAFMSEVITQAAIGAQAIRSAVATTVVDSYLRATDQTSGLRDAASAMARLVPGVERFALARTESDRVTSLVVADQPALNPTGDLSRLLAGLIEEALDNPDVLQTASQEPPTPAQQEYETRFGKHGLMSVVAPGRRLGAAAAFDRSEDATRIAPQIAPALDLLERVINDRPPRFSARSQRRWLTRTALALAIVALLAVFPRADIVEAPATLQADWQQIISAPFDGVVERSSVQPGDWIDADATQLARLQTRDIELEIAASRARAANERREATVARANGQPAQEQVALLSAARAEAQLALLEQRLRSAEVKSPRSGVIVSGDLRRSLGQPVLRGQTLFELAPKDTTRAEIQVLDEDIARVEAGQEVWILPAAEPNKLRHGIVERVHPMAELVQARNSFLVVAKLDQTVEALRPGSEGVARIETGRTTLLWSLLRQPVRFVRRWLWI